MGAGRKTSTSSYDSANSPGGGGGGGGGGRVPIPPDRNLGPELGGVIFGTTAATMKGAGAGAGARVCVCACVRCFRFLDGKREQGFCALRLTRRALLVAPRTRARRVPHGPRLRCARRHTAAARAARARTRWLARPCARRFLLVVRVTTHDATRRALRAPPLPPTRATAAPQACRTATSRTWSTSSPACPSSCSTTQARAHTFTKAHTRR
jgi:hypothetical protein